jgi:hypothetical protein
MLFVSQALDERRLTLFVDTSGQVRKAGESTPHELFGFSPRILVGRRVSDIIDAFGSTSSRSECGLLHAAMVWLAVLTAP